jgi:1-acyl-sn-glycerol-3-phosphate acyltransferase
MPVADHDTYITDPDRKRSFFSRIFLSPKFSFYPQLYCIVRRSGRQALNGRYGDREWAESSREVMEALENVGVCFELTGMDNMRKVPGPVVFIGNHMSTLETMVLPCIIEPVQHTTFIVKASLVTMPVFGPVMRSRDPILVNRTNPREDLKAVMERGLEKLKAGISIIVFPQSTRTFRFNPEDFNTLGVKLAARAGVPVIPMTMKTDAWGNGRYIKEFGPIDTSKKVYFTFGEPMSIAGRGTEEHEKIIAFIQENLKRWPDKNG